MPKYSDFAVWDLETTGIKKAFDAPTDVGLITTDADLNTKGELALACRPSIYSLPAPGAMLVTGIGIKEMLGRDMSLREMIFQLHGHVAAMRNTCFMSYNGISFDDEIYRHTAYRNLSQPYVFAYNGNRRLDILTLARAAQVVLPGLIHIPLADNGKLSFKLDVVAPANGFTEPGAHDALVDARATLHLARLIKEGAPGLWELACETWTDKDQVKKLLQENDFVVEVSWNSRSGAPVVKALVPIGPNPIYSNEYTCFDLAFDPDELSGASADDLLSQVCIGTKPRPICTVRLNAMPTVFPPSHPLVQGLLPGSLSGLLERSGTVRANTKLMTCAPAALELRRGSFPDPDHVEQMLYSGGFIPRADEALMARFNMADPATRLKVLDQLQDERLKILGRRILFEESPDVLPLDIRNSMTAELQARLHPEGSTPWTSVASAREEIAEKMPSATSEQQILLQDYAAFLDKLPFSILQAAE